MQLCRVHIELKDAAAATKCVTKGECYGNIIAIEISRHVLCLISFLRNSMYKYLLKTKKDGMGITVVG